MEAGTSASIAGVPTVRGEQNDSGLHVDGLPEDFAEVLCTKGHVKEPRANERR